MTTAPPTSHSRPAGTREGLEDLRGMVNAALDILQDVAADRPGPLPLGGPPAARAAAARALSEPLLAERGGEPTEVFHDLVRAYAEWSVDLTHPAAVARMQPAPTVVAAAAELVVATLNQSLHAWESGPFALELDRWVVRELGSLVGYGSGSGGTLTAGGSVSNLMALVAARDAAVSARFGELSRGAGLHDLGVQLVVLCSPTTHFSIGRAARIVGIGEDHVLTVAQDRHGRMLPEAADRMLASLPEEMLAVGLMATGGSTDLGVVDPLAELAEVARRHRVWMHVDAAYGGGVLFSPRLRGLLDGLAEADSVTLDLHKFGWMPASSAALLVRTAETFTSFRLQATTCLTSDDDTLGGYTGSQGTSLQTTRRADALKIAVTLRTLGRSTMAAMVDACHELACAATSRLLSEPRVELATDSPAMTAVLFRYLPEASIDADAFNGALRRRLMESGTALLARTHVPQPDGRQRVFLKLMLLNPDTTVEQLGRVIDQVLDEAAALEAAALEAGGKMAEPPRRALSCPG